MNIPRTVCFFKHNLRQVQSTLSSHNFCKITPVPKHTKTYQNIPKPHLSDAWIALRPSNFDLSRDAKITETRCWCKDVQSKRVIQSSTRSHLPFLGQWRNLDTNSCWPIRSLLFVICLLGTMHFKIF